MAFSSQFPGAPWLNATQPQKANGLLGLLGVSSNPFTDFLGNNSNALIGLGAGIAGGGPDLGQAVGQGLTLAGQGKTADFNRSEKAKADATLAANQTMTQKWLAQNRPDLSGLPVDQAWQIAMKAQTGGSNGPTFSQTPVFLTDGKSVHAAQMSSDGGLFVDGKTLPGIPSGWSVVARPDNLSNVDLGGNMAVFDPNSGTYKTGPAKQGAPSANLDVTMNPDGTRTMQPAQGSPEAIKQQGNMTAAQTALGSIEQKQGLVASNIDRALQLAQTVPSTGPFSLLNAVPGMPQYDLKATLDTIKANVGFDQLQQMREASPTGGALGQVSEQENRLLQSVLGSLDQAQSLQQFVQNLQLLKQTLAQSTDARRRAFAQDFPNSGLPQGASPVGPGPQTAPIDLGNGITIQEIP